MRQLIAVPLMLALTIALTGGLAVTAAAANVEVVLNGLAIQLDADSGGIVSMSYDGPGQLLTAEPGEASLLDMATPLPQFEPLRTGTPVVKALSIEQVSLFRAYMRIADFWRMPTVDTSQGDSGNLWTLEGARQGNYRWLTRNAPKDMYFIDAAIYLIRLAGLNTTEFLVKDAKINWMHG